MRRLSDLRVIDFGVVSPLRSQTLWHAIARGVSRGAPPTLSFMQPRSPYVSIGFHRHIDEVDRAWCSAQALPVFRRMVGGGPVYLDDGQYFFQLIVPAAQAPAMRALAVRTMLAPAVEAFRAAGVDAAIDSRNEVVVGDQKICGHGAGQIDEAVIVVGNVITRFDHRSAARVLAAPDGVARSELERMMRRYVRSTPVVADQFRKAAISAYGASLGAPPHQGELGTEELGRLAELDAQFVTESWIRDSPPRPAGPWSVKIKSGVWVASEHDERTRVTLSAVEARVVRIRIDDARLNGRAERLEQGFVGVPVGQLRERGCALAVPENIPDLLSRLEGSAPR